MSARPAGDLFDLSGRVAVVTGGGRGIGRAISEALARYGATVVAGGRRPEPLAETVAAIREAGGEAWSHPLEVSEESSVIALREAVLERHGRIDILINNAGIDPHYAPLEKTSFEDWRKILDVNLSGVFRCCRHLGTAMLERGGGAIVNVSSIAGRVAFRRQVPYCASKGGVEMLTRALALDWADRGVRVNAVAYAFILTDLTRDITGHEHLSKRLLARTPMGRFGRVEETVGAVLFLAAEKASSYVTGTTVMVDGGWTAA